MCTKTLLEQATKAKSRAYSPYSQYNVGACVSTANGEFFSGCNVENASYGVTICAEVNAITNMISAGAEPKINEIFIISSGDDYCTPCGRCRQMIREFMSPQGLIHCAKNNGEYKTYTLEQLLPESFGPEHLK